MGTDSERYDRVIRLLAHDVRNPLTAVQLNAQIIEQAAARDGREKDQRLAARITSAARRLDGMLQQLVEAERIRSGHVQLVREPVALAQWLRELVAKESAKKSANDSPGVDPARIRVTLPDDGVVISADPVRLGQALVHLLGLALRQADGNSVVGVDVQAGSEEVTCTLRAPGRPENGAYKPASPPNTGESVGSQPSDGMALHLARTLVECHGGHLLVEEDAARGLRFEVVLPVSAKA